VQETKSRHVVLEELEGVLEEQELLVSSPLKSRMSSSVNGCMG